MERHQPDVALIEQAGDFRRVDLAEEQHVVQIARCFLRFQPGKLGAAADEQESDIVTVAQRADQLHEDIHALGHAHIADIDEDLAARERGLPDRDAAPDIRRNG